MRILLVEDDPALARLVVRGLRREHHAVDHCTTAAEAIDALVTTSYDVACVDLGLPDGDGLDLCRRVIAASGLQQPRRIIIVTARDAVEQRVAGLDAGADDYLVKPFKLTELAARIRAVSRREDQRTTTLVVGDIEVHRDSHLVQRGDRRVDLTSREYSVLRHLAEHREQIVSAEQLLEHCWDAHADEFTASVRVIVSRLRRKLGEPQAIETIRGAGYRLSHP
ncbi:MAG: response regulator transcription factor [Acidimicrobiales bacterium]